MLYESVARKSASYDALEPEGVRVVQAATTAALATLKKYSNTDLREPRMTHESFF